MQKAGRRLTPRTTAYDDTVEKVERPDRARIEAMKTAAAYQVARSTGRFRVPEIRHHDEAAGLLVFERIPNLRPLRVALRESDDPVELVERTGAALAAIHAHMVLPTQFRVPMRAPWTDPRATQAFVHGDFNTTNVQVTTDTRELVVLDWAFTDIWGGEATYGPASFDAMWMVHNMLFGSTLRFRPIPRVERLAGTFLRAYLRSHGGSTQHDAEVLRSYLRRARGSLAANHRSRKSVLRSQVDRVRFARFDRFVEELDLARDEHER